MKRQRRIGNQYRSAFAAVIALALAAPACAAPAAAVLADLDLSKPFATRAPWRFTATQSAPILDPVMEDSSTAPGPIELCLRARPAARCDPELSSATGVAAPYADLHYLLKTEIVHPRGTAGRPLLFVQAGSLRSVDNGQVILTQVMAYRSSRDSFVRVFDHWTGHNNNQETRYISSGPLRGDIITVEPAAHAPFDYWVTVSALAPHGAYRQVLRYRSATRYDDGNGLAVIDSEMANTLQRLGLWKRGDALPLPPSGACPRPRLVRMELWCR